MSDTKKSQPESLMTKPQLDAIMTALPDELTHVDIMALFSTILAAFHVDARSVIPMMIQVGVAHIELDGENGMDAVVATAEPETAAA